MQHVGAIKLSRDSILTIMESLATLLRRSTGKLKARQVYQTRVTQPNDCERRKCAAMTQSNFWADLLLRSNSASKIGKTR